ncbi:glycosyltransferase family 4 protein [Enterococcus dongliensis]|uniref:Glycosyltransferase family 4 protein n=1 Tax=Enterococcus dongliensis TaxID=2559925 RepID=A0AAP5KRW9_9ENTE|nr:glycosyltransferase family 4 protein [Enterococcus dongliensis]MDT2597481.1 glycosyltransferase family 4 protein [Enterococcus dongliensis]MDT2603075.1 glycosyltransferase family 4 protein [Enterococcus dongliensis]MDT2633419.1 glycosyltransferase family 4 protein [Enterococcus dongliensis]MDT2636770.1 glycosyltransferase family 4 protein [Enterococcus dongliensis]MDT2638889.1 glycosyltransferase family 4 protein [Enterococcus dongliensis]
MRIGFFTDTYFPQVSGVATSIRTLKNELEKQGHEVYIFTTTDPEADEFEKDIVRMPSVPFVSFTDRRIVVRGIWFAYRIAKELELEIIHTHTEFGAGFLGKMVANRLRIPVVHTYHTMYEDYLHYIANGKVVRPTHVKHFIKMFINHSTGVVCPSKRVVDTLKRYEVDIPMRIIPTGIEVAKFIRPEITKEDTDHLREKLGIQKDELMILSLSRISYEKNIHIIVQQFSDILMSYPTARLVIVGKGPYREELEEMTHELGIDEYVQFTGEVSHEDVAYYYHAADYFVSASTSETQGLTYAEAIASGTQCVVEGNDYLNQLLDDDSLGTTFEKDEDFSDSFIRYVQQQIPLDPQIRQNKLIEISAERFGNEVLKFYQEMLVYYAEHHSEGRVPTRTVQKMRVRINSFRNGEDK